MCARLQQFGLSVECYTVIITDNNVYRNWLGIVWVVVDRNKTSIRKIILKENVRTVLYTFFTTLFISG